MGLQEAIEHAREVAEGCASENKECAYQHDKLADWLEELRRLKDILGDDYDLNRLQELMNQRMSMREDVAERIKLVGSIPLDHLRDLVEADRDGRFIIVTRCCECKNHCDLDGDHWCKFWHMYCPDDSEFYCKAARK